MPRYVIVVTRRVSYSDGSSVAYRFGVADRDRANRIVGPVFVSRAEAQGEAERLAHAERLDFLEAQA